jgi:hypothetical protein
MWEFRSRLRRGPFTITAFPARNLCLEAHPPQTKVEFTGWTAGLDFEFARPCHLRDVGSHDGERLVPLAIQGPASGSRHGGMRAMTPPPQPNKKTAVDATAHFRGWKGNAFQQAPAYGRQGDS